MKTIRVYVRMKSGTMLESSGLSVDQLFNLIRNPLVDSVETY